MIPDTPEDARRRARRAASITGDCTKCGQPVYHGNLAKTKDGQALCPACFGPWLAEKMGVEG